MIKTLQDHGNSQALLIDKTLQEALGINSGTQLQLTISGNSLIVTPVNIGLGPEKVASAIKKLRKKYSGMLTNLAK